MWSTQSAVKAILNRKYPNSPYTLHLTLATDDTAMIESMSEKGDPSEDIITNHPLWMSITVGYGNNIRNYTLYISSSLYSPYQRLMESTMDLWTPKPVPAYNAGLEFEFDSIKCKSEITGTVIRYRTLCLLPKNVDQPAMPAAIEPQTTYTESDWLKSMRE